MIIFPAIDLYNGKAVRLFKGDYNQMTVYSEHPENIGLDFADSGAQAIHIVDLEGAKSASTPNFESVIKIKESSGLFCEIGGGIRNMKTVEKYLEAGIDRVIIGTAAVKDKDFLMKSVDKYGERIAVGIDIKDGVVAINGWLEKSDLDAFSFTENMISIGVKTIICTDISKDGAMVGTNRLLYKDLSSKFNINITASGGISSIDDIRALADMNIYGAIIGKAYYIGAINLKEAIKEGNR